ncbi:hypothetical protein KUTeg_005605 [Tegillarca granosa]|uniref:PA domain-containing protein n=1 Tax=Tegillarca granosa TaxID=220873 RepID=A0ABQ9FLT9_TEGGR|nr:hypothetical protein KUTeg_005605 [Tegillarca granosa]
MQILSRHDLLHKQHFGIQMVPAEPYHGCSAFTNEDLLKNSVVLVDRGGCSFLTKTLNIQQAGGIAAIIADNDKENFEAYVDMIQDGTERPVTIPALFLLGKDGFMIRKSLEKAKLLSAVINIPVNITGVPSMRLNQPPWTFCL